METLDYQEFLAYLFLYGASADLVISDTEIQLILERVGRERFDKAKALFEGKSDYERLQFILAHKEAHFPTEEEKSKVLSQLKDLFYVDKEFSVMEQNFIRILQKIL